MAHDLSLGIVGGTGWLGGAIARALLRHGFVAPERLWLSNRSGAAPAFEAWPGVHVTARNRDLAEACSALLLAVPPRDFPSIGLDAAERLVISVMAGVTIDRMAEVTGARRIVRAMSNPAADLGLAYSPWCANEAVTPEDRTFVQALFDACGQADEVPNEDQIDYFTALTGPTPGFVACYAECMIQAAVKRGIDAKIAERAVRQLFHASGVLMAQAEETPAEQVQAMIDYAGTTAAGLRVLQDSPLAATIEAGLAAAYEKARGGMIE